MTPLSLQWSPEQLAIFEHATRACAPNLIVTAVAGSGKSTTLREYVRHIPRLGFLPPAILVLAFNKSTKEAMAEKIGTAARCETFNAYGLSVLRGAFPKIKVDPKKGFGMVYRAFKREHPDVRAAVRALSLLKSFWPLPTRPSEAGHMLLQNDVDFEDATSLGKVLRVLEESVRDTASCDFDDMLVMPLIHNVPFPSQDFILVDEAQDTNGVQLEILARSGKQRLEKDLTYTSQTTYVFVGDPAQAIYGFRGANADSMDLIRERFACETLPLSVTYRCPRLHVLLAQTYEKNVLITARPNAPLGEVHRPAHLASDMFLPGSAVLCRNTAPLVRFCYSLLLRDIPCHIAGREIGTGLLALARAAKSTNLNEVNSYVCAWRRDNVTKAALEDRSPERYNDQADALLFLMDGLTSFVQLEARIQRVFDNSGGGVLLSTIHKAKGGEWDRVFLLDFDKLLPSRYARLPWQQQQERNLQYVAVTRSKSVLYFIESERWEDSTQS